jgi:hypothetical protein
MKVKLNQEEGEQEIMEEFDTYPVCFNFLKIKGTCFYFE